MAITGLIRAPPLLGEAARGAHQDLKRYPFMLKRTNYFESFPLWAASNQSYFESFLPWAAPNQSYFETFLPWAAPNQSYFETFLPWAAPNQSKTQKK
jgi:hypothetical protein